MTGYLVCFPGERSLAKVNSIVQGEEMNDGVEIVLTNNENHERRLMSSSSSQQRAT